MRKYVACIPAGEHRGSGRVSMSFSRHLAAAVRHLQNALNPWNQRNPADFECLFSYASIYFYSKCVDLLIRIINMLTWNSSNLTPHRHSCVHGVATWPRSRSDTTCIFLPPQILYTFINQVFRIKAWLRSPALSFIHPRLVIEGKVSILGSLIPSTAFLLNTLVTKKFFLSPAMMAM